MPAFSRMERLALALVPPLAAAAIRLLGCTLRFEQVTEPGVQTGWDRPRPSIYVFWHRSLLACAYHFRNHDIAILISQSFDGELIARSVERLGFFPVRGSSSRGSASALRSLESAYHSGHICAITADGPRGPLYVAKPGAAHLATLVDAQSVVAFYAHPLRAWQLRSWDRFLIPKPFSRVLIAWSPPARSNGNGSIPLNAIQGALEHVVDLAETAAARESS